MSLAFNKVAVPFNDTLLYKRAFTALKDNGKNNKKAREFHAKTLLAKTISRMYLHAKQMQKVHNLRNVVRSREVSEIFEAFIATLQRQRMLRKKQ